MPLPDALAPDETSFDLSTVAPPTTESFSLTDEAPAPVSEYSDHDPNHPEYLQPTDATPPSPKEAKFEKYDADGSAVFSNGVKYLPNGSIRWEDKDTGTIFEQKNPYVKAVTIGKKKEAPKPDVKMINDGSGLSLPYEYKDGKYVKVPVEGQATTQTDDIPEGVTGEDAIKDLPPADQAAVRSFAHYVRQPPTAGRVNPTYNRLERYIMAYRPDYSGSVGFKEATTVNNEFASSRSAVAGGQIVAANTSMRHLSRLSDVADKLDNAQVRKYNGLINYFKTETGNPNVQEFNRERDTLVGEFQKMITGGVPYADDVRRGIDQLSAANSPEQLKSVIKSMAGLMSDKLSELDFRYSNVFKKPYAGLVNPDVKKIAQKFGINDFAGRQEGPETSPAPAPSATPGPTVAPNEAEAEARRIIATSKDPVELAKAQKVLSIIDSLR